MSKMKRPVSSISYTGALEKHCNAFQSAMASRHSKFGRCVYIALGSFDRLDSIATDSVCNFDGDKWDVDDLTSRSRCGNKKGRAATYGPFT
jgi:hypothetical protein